MNWIPRLSVQKSVLVNLIMAALLGGGIWALSALPQEQVPNVSFPWAFILVVDPGVSPEEMEKTVTIPLEDELKDLDDLDSMISNSREGAAFVWLKFKTMPDDEFQRRLQDVRTEVQKVDLPESAEDPDITQFKTQDFAPLISVVIRGEGVSEHEMKRIAEDLEDDILDIRNVSQVQISGVREREVWIEADPARLERYGLTLAEVSAAVRTKHLNATGGDIETGNKDFRVRTTGEAPRIADLGNVIVRATPGGGHVRVSDVAEVSDTFEDEVSRSRFDGVRAVTLTVAKKQEGNSIRIIDQVKELAALYERERLPEGMDIVFTNDSSKYINDVLSTLKSNAWIGMALVFVALAVFLGTRQALFAAIGIPVALATTFLFIQLTGNTINGSTLFAIVLVLGMLVDDAIVVIENCYRYMQRGMSPREAAVVGTSEVMTPVLTSAMTTMAAFLPLMLLPGVIGDFMRVIPEVVTLALIASLFESFFILPAHIADWSSARAVGHELKPLIGFGAVRRRYRKLLVGTLRRRYLVLGVTTLVIIASLPLVGVLGVDLFADEEIPMFFAYVTLPEGTRLDATDRVIRRIEALTREEIPDSDLKSVVGTSGQQELESEWVVKPSVGQLLVELNDARDRQFDVATSMERVRRRAEEVPGVVALEFKRISSGPPTGAPVEAKVVGEHLDELIAVSDEVQAFLATVEGVKDIRDNFLEGVPELRVVVDEERAAMLGLRVADVAGAVTTAFDGSVATQFLDGKDDIDVLVRLRRDARSERADLENLRITTPSGARVVLKDVARVEEAAGYASIKRDDNERAITVSAGVDDEVISGVEASRLLQEAWPTIAARHPGYDLKFGGEFQEFVDAFRNLGMLFLVGISIMLLIMTAQFNSILQPMIIFMAVIFAFWGAVMGLLLIGSPFSINNLFGLVALAGVAVNNSIVLISFINSMRERGVNRFRAVLVAGELRVRPILLTSLTTVVGLVPMAIGLGGYSAVWGPLATIMVWGLSVSSILSLFLIPCLYIASGDARRLMFRVTGRARSEHESRVRWTERKKRRRELAGLDVPR